MADQSFKFKLFKEYAGHLLKNCLERVVKESYCLIKSNKYYNVENDKSYQERKIHAFLQQHLESFLLQVQEDSALNYILSHVNKWQQNDLYIPFSESLDVSDLMDIYNISKEVFLKLLPEYTTDVTRATAIVLELDKFYNTLQSKLYNTNLDVQKEELRQEKELTESIINNIINGIIAFDKNFCVTVWNEVIEKRSGIKRELVLNKSLFELFPKYKDTLVFKSVKLVFSGESVAFEEVTFGDIVGIFDIRLLPIHNINGQVESGLCVLSDVTGRRALESKLKSINVELEAKVKDKSNDLQESTEKFRLLMEAIPQMAWTARADGRIDYYNQRWIDYTGQDFEEALHDGWRSIQHPDDVVTTTEKFKHSMRTGEVFETENRLRNKHSDEYRWHLTRAVPVQNEKGELLLWVGTCTDTHELKQALERYEKTQKQLSRKNKELQRINNDLDNFIYTASHDLKAPVANLEGLIIMLFRQLGPHIGSTESALMGMINSTVTKLYKTIKDLTEITKAQKWAGKQIEVVSFDSVLDDLLIGEFAMQIEQIKPEIVRDFDVAVINYSWQDLRTILYNLLSNALKFRSPDRPLNISISTEEIDRYVVLSFSDNGLGIKKGQESKVFNMFRRLHSHVEGSGIGLYIIKRIIENNRGKIEVESEFNEGTTFKVYFKKNKSDNYLD